MTGFDPGRVGVEILQGVKQAAEVHAGALHVAAREVRDDFVGVGRDPCLAGSEAFAVEVVFGDRLIVVGGLFHYLAGNRSGGNV
jgi:hypothetical protein